MKIFPSSRQIVLVTAVVWLLFLFLLVVSFCNVPGDVTAQRPTPTYDPCVPYVCTPTPDPYPPACSYPPCPDGAGGRYFVYFPVVGKN